VVDPQLKGKVKITVIATGFDRKISSRGMPGEATQTPVDLTSYTQHVSRPVDAPAAAQMKARTVATADLPLHAPVMDHAGMAPALTVNRRPGIEMSVPNVAATVSAGSPSPEHELQTPFDVPAFLRRPH